MARRPAVLAERLALSVGEAAAAVGVSERHLQGLLPEIPHTYLGKRLVIPVGPFEKWLAARTKAEPNQVDETVGEILKEFS